MADEPRYTAERLLREIQGRGGRVFRMTLNAVFCLTNDVEVAEWLVGLGGKTYTPPAQGGVQTLDGGYWRSKGVREWDIYIHAIPVKGTESVWEAAKRNRRVQYQEVA